MFCSFCVGTETGGTQIRTPQNKKEQLSWISVREVEFLKRKAIIEYGVTVITLSEYTLIFANCVLGHPGFEICEVNRIRIYVV